MLTRVFKSGNSLAVRIPKELHFVDAAQDVEVERVGNTLVLRPVVRETLAGIGEIFGMFSPSFMTDGREFYFAAKIHLGDALFAAARVLDAGQVSAPVTLPDGVHILVMKANVRPAAQPFDQIRDRVLAAYVDDQAKRLNGANERFLLKRADVQIAKGFE